MSIPTRFSFLLWRLRDCLDGFNERLNPYAKIARLQAQVDLLTEQASYACEDETNFYVYTVDVHRDGYPVRYAKNDQSIIYEFCGPFGDPGEASQEFQACVGGGRDCEYLDTIDFDTLVAGLDTPDWYLDAFCWKSAHPGGWNCAVCLQAYQAAKEQEVRP